MIGHEHIRAVLVEILASFNLDRQKQNAHDEPRPPLAGIIAPEMSVADMTADDDRTAVSTVRTAMRGSAMHN